MSSERQETSNLFQSVSNTWEHENIRTYISELDHAQFSKLADTAVGCLWLEKELSQGHLLTSEQFPHDGNLTPPQLE